MNNRYFVKIIAFVELENNIYFGFGKMPIYYFQSVADKHIAPSFYSSELEIIMLLHTSLKFFFLVLNIEI